MKSSATALVMILASAVPGVAGETSIAELRAMGWTEIEKRDEIKKLPGEAPYENLTRVIQVTHFVFEKDGARRACRISYDSQRDQIRESCEPVE